MKPYEYMIFYLVFFLEWKIINGKPWGSTTATSQENEESNHGSHHHHHHHHHRQDEGYTLLVVWMKSHGGRVNEMMAIAPVDGIRGAVALSDMEEGTELLFCPWKLVIGSSNMEDQMESEEDMCNVVNLVASEYQRGEQSVSWPYLNHIELPRLPDMWDPEAVQELQGLPPTSVELSRHRRWFSKNCNGGGADDLDDSTLKSLVAFVSRASVVGMVPIYDLLNHHNGLKNAKLFLSEEGVYLRTVSAISKGQQIYLSYGLKASYQMYRDYGFVESWPSLWSWKDVTTNDNHVFALYRDGIAAIHPSADFLKDIWHASPPRPELDCQRSATEYTHSLDHDSLVRFGTAAKSLLNGLLTSLDEDKDILKERKRARKDQATQASSPEESTAGALDDVIQAINYRMAFKAAVSHALTFSEESLKRSINANAEL